MMEAPAVAAIRFLTGMIAASLPAPAAREEQSAWVAAQRGVAIPLRDGKELAADVFLPTKPGRYPTILIQTPYNRERTGAAMPGADEAPTLFDRAHYALVVADWRGFYGSRAAGEEATLPQRGRDGYDAVEWIARQPWSDGKVGTWGPSALGRVQYLTAQQQPPHLRCCVPIVAADHSGYADYYENGVYREAHVRLLDRLGFNVSRIAHGAPLSSAPVYRLAAMAVRPERLNVPMLLITGWYDPGVAQQLRTFTMLKTQAGAITRQHSKIVIGPWHHTAIGLRRQGELEFPGAENERDRVSRLCFDYWLRGERGDWEQLPTVRWWQMGEEGWHAAESLEAIQTRAEQWNLHADGRLDPRPPAAGAAPRSYVSDPKEPVRTRGGANVGFGTAGGLGIGPMDQRELEARPDVLVYTSAPMQAPLRLFGSVMVTLRFAIDRPDASFAVRLCEVYPDGRSMLICDGITRAKYREGTDHPAPVEPGRVYRATVALPPTAITIRPGHCLRVSVAGSNYPRFELNPHTGADHYDAATAVPARCTLYHDAERPSTLVLPVLEEMS
ncbi:MAG: CocE/NonD family hydrolase [Armatimonadetes bacterium]|jgi:predicted acyl esterase|nr:CocE/NonD family hydrolase [Armatimonadota bacterium]